MAFEVCLRPYLNPCKYLQPVSLIGSLHAETCSLTECFEGLRSVTGANGGTHRLRTVGILAVVQ